MTDLDPSASSSSIPLSSSSGASSPRSAPRATVYGPAVFGTVRVDDPRALAELRAARAPAVPAAAPRAVASGQIVTAAAPTPRLAIVGLILALIVPPLGCVVSALALGRIVQGRPRPPGEALAGFGLALSVIAMTIAIAVAAS